MLNNKRKCVIPCFLLLSVEALDQPEPVGLDTAFCHNISVATFRMHCPMGDGVDNDGFFKGIGFGKDFGKKTGCLGFSLDDDNPTQLLCGDYFINHIL